MHNFKFIYTITNTLVSTNIFRIIDKYIYIVSNYNLTTTVNLI